MLHAPMLDHLAVASSRAWDNFCRYVVDLGGDYLGGSDDAPFYFSHVAFEGGTKLELLQPIDDPGSDFLVRFLDRNGPGPHHLTFKQPSLTDAIEKARSAGYEPVGISTERDDWQEAFLHPKQSHGIVIQMAQAGIGDETPWAEPTSLPPMPRSEPANITRLEHLVVDMERAVAMFTIVLGCVVDDTGTDDRGTWTDLTSGPWTLRLITPTLPAMRQWLADRSGRFWQMCVSLDDPAMVPRVAPHPAGGYVLEPEHNLGLRVHLS